MYLKTDCSGGDTTQYTDCVPHTNYSAVTSDLNLTYRIIKDRVETFDHPDVENPFKSRLTPLQDDILGGYMVIVGE